MGLVLTLLKIFQHITWSIGSRGKYLLNNILMDILVSHLVLATKAQKIILLFAILHGTNLLALVPVMILA